MEYRTKLLNPKWAQAMAGQVRVWGLLGAARMLGCFVLPLPGWCVAHLGWTLSPTCSHRACAAPGGAPCSPDAAHSCARVAPGGVRPLTRSEGRWPPGCLLLQGSGGAFEISQRMTALLGWGATVNYRDQFAWDQAADT